MSSFLALGKCGRLCGLIGLDDLLDPHDPHNPHPHEQRFIVARADQPSFGQLQPRHLKSVINGVVRRENG